MPQEVFELLGKRHAAPSLWAPQVKARDVFIFKRDGRAEYYTKQALARMPALLRTYLVMVGGGVRDHVVFDRDLETMHVFTAVDINAIP